MAVQDKYLELSGKFLTGVNEMDKEHQQLVNLINRMYSIFQNQGDSGEILHVLDDLLEYGAHHFADEEAFMEREGVPDLEEHKQIHKNLIRQAIEIRDKLKSGQTGVGIETFKFLQNWLMGHIAGVDVKKYGKANNDVRQLVDSSGGYDANWLYQTVLNVTADDSLVALANEKGVVTHIRKVSHFPFPIDVGTDVSQPQFANMISARAWKERRILKQEGNPQLFGFPYFAISEPVFVQGEFKGVLSVVMKTSHTQELEDGLFGLTDQVGVLDTLAREMASAGTSFAQNVDAIATAVHQLNENAKALVSINNLVAEVAAQTNLLGLNAAIEAARAGELGRGFGVVADEIRRLSQMVRESSKQVNDKVNEITQEIDHIQEAVQESMASSEEQAAQLEELSATVSHVHETTEGLRKIL